MCGEYVFAVYLFANLLIAMLYIHTVLRTGFGETVDHFGAAFAINRASNSEQMTQVRRLRTKLSLASSCGIPAIPHNPTKVEQGRKLQKSLHSRRGLG